jgi:hypothetical protein
MLPQDLDVFSLRVDVFFLLFYILSLLIFTEKEDGGIPIYFLVFFVWICSPPMWIYFSDAIKISARKEKGAGG